MSSTIAHMNTRLPLAVTMGDPAGIGPEVMLKALAHPEVREAGPLLLVGCRGAFDETAQRLGLDFRSSQVASPQEVIEAALDVGVYEITDVEFDGGFGGLDPRLAGAAAACVEQAALFALGGEVAGIVTAPLTKEGLALAGRDYPGHTEMLAALAGAEGRELMLLVGGGLRVALVTTHLAIARLPQVIGSALVESRLAALDAGLRGDLGLAEPRIAVLALNPHGGEGGRFGDEESLHIAPAVEAMRARGTKAVGPIPADTAFHKALAGEFDAVLAMYHDQGLAVLKALAFDSGVNVTLGLPFVRTSPDHGTAYDIAGQGKASERSAVEAIKLAREIANRRLQT